MPRREPPLIYADLLRFKPEELTPNAWAVLAGVSRTVWADMRRHGNPSRRTLEKLLSAAGSSLAEFEALRIGSADREERKAGFGFAEPGAADWPGQQLPSLPLIASMGAGKWGDPQLGIAITAVADDRVSGSAPRPASLARHARAYAVAITDDSMWPRFRPGRLVAVVPGWPIAAGDDVLVRLAQRGSEGNTLALIKTLAAQTASEVELRQFNPDVTFAVPVEAIASMEKVLGELV